MLRRSSFWLPEITVPSCKSFPTTSTHKNVPNNQNIVHY